MGRRRAAAGGAGWLTSLCQQQQHKGGITLFARRARSALLRCTTAAARLPRTFLSLLLNVCWRFRFCSDGALAWLRHFCTVRRRAARNNFARRVGAAREQLCARTGDAPLTAAVPIPSPTSPYGFNNIYSLVFFIMPTTILCRTHHAMFCGARDGSRTPPYLLVGHLDALLLHVITIPMLLLSAFSTTTCTAGIGFSSLFFSLQCPLAL